MLGVLLLLGIGAGVYYFTNQQPTTDNSLLKTISPTVQPTIDPTAEWKTYTNSTHGFLLKYPTTITLQEESELFGRRDEDYILLANQIEVRVTSFNPLNCRGDCPVIEKQEQVTVAGYPATKVFGYIGAVGGNIPQRYQSVVLEKNKKYYVFDIYELEREMVSPPDDIELGEIPAYKLALFNQILSTFKFTDSDQENDLSGNASIRSIEYENREDWEKFTSQLGLTLQHPKNLKPVFQIFHDKACTTTISEQGVNGFILVIVRPYDGGSRRALLGTSDGSKYEYEEVLIQGKKSLLRQEAATQEPKFKAAAAIPVGSHAVIISWSDQRVSGENFTSLLQSLQIPSEFDLSKCNTINNP